jgi:hypothetical protein
MWLLYAPPWQQLLICLIFILVGVALIIVLGHVAGVVPILFGFLFAVPALTGLRRGRSARQRTIGSDHGPTGQASRRAD